MLHLLLDWEYPHWMMMAGAILVAAGLIGLAFHRNMNGPVNESSRARESTPTERLKKDGPEKIRAQKKKSD